MRKLFEKNIGPHDWEDQDSNESYEDQEDRFIELLEHNFQNTNRGYDLRENIEISISETKDEFLESDKYGFLNSSRHDLLISDFRDRIDHCRTHIDN
jgi:hypothetical protein